MGPHTHAHTTLTNRREKEKSKAHTSTHTLPGLVLSIRQDPEHVLLGLMFAFLLQAASLPAFKVSVFRDVLPGAGGDLCRLPDYFFERRKLSFFSLTTHAMDTQALKQFLMTKTDMASTR